MYRWICIYIYMYRPTHTYNLVLIFCTLYNLFCLGGNRKICSHMLHKTMVPNASKPWHVSMTSLARTVTQRPPQLGIACAENKTSEWPFVAPSLTGEICHHFLWPQLIKPESQGETSETYQYFIWIFKPTMNGPKPKYNSQNLNKFDEFHDQQHVGSPRRLWSWLDAE